MSDMPFTPPPQTDGTLQSSGQTSGAFVRRMIDSHSVLGLGLAALIYIVSLTGAFTLFVPEISLWENPGTATARTISPEVAAAAMRNAEAQLEPGNDILNVILYAPDAFSAHATVRLNQRADRKSELESRDWVIDPRSGALLGTIDTPYAHYIEDLHTMLHLPQPWGRYLVGLVGVVMFTLILSGIFAHPTIVTDAFKLRLERNARLAWTDVHNRLSVWGLPYHLVLTFTGAFLGVAGITISALAFVAYAGDTEKAIAVINGPQAIEGAPPMTGSPDYAAMLRASQAEGRSFSLLVANNPKDSGSTTQVLYAEAGLLSSNAADIYRNSGEFLTKMGGSGAPWGARVFGTVQPLHYGTFGGYPIKLFYFVMALALTYITSTGMMIWFKRKAQQGEPKPRSEAAWRGMTTGLTLSLAAGAALAASGAELPLATVGLVIWAVVFVVIWWSPRPLPLVRAGWLASAALLTVAATLNSAAVADGAATSWLVNAVLVISAAGFVLASLRLEAKEEGEAEPKVITMPAE